MYKRPNGRIQHRRGNGQFYTPSMEEMGFDTNDTYKVCANCNYGDKEKWFPVLKSGICPECGSEEKKEKVTPSQLCLDILEKIEAIRMEPPFMSLGRATQIQELQREYDTEYKECAKLAFPQ